MRISIDHPGLIEDVFITPEDKETMVMILKRVPNKTLSKPKVVELLKKFGISMTFCENAWVINDIKNNYQNQLRYKQ